MSQTRPFMLGTLTATVALAVGVFVGVLLSDDGAPPTQAASDLAPHVDALTRAVEGLARQRPAPLRASSPTGAATATSATPADASPDPQPLDVGPARDALAAQVAALRARVADLEARGGGAAPGLRSLGDDGELAPRIPMRIEAVEAVIDSDDDARSDEFLFLTQRQLYERLGSPSGIRDNDAGLMWTYTPGSDPRRNRYVLFTFHDGMVIRVMARR